MDEHKFVSGSVRIEIETKDGKLFKIVFDEPEGGYYDFAFRTELSEAIKVFRDYIARYFTDNAKLLGI